MMRQDRLGGRSGEEAGQVSRQVRLGGRSFEEAGQERYFHAILYSILVNYFKF